MRPRGRALVAAGVAAAVSLVLVATSPAATRVEPVTVTVTAKDYSFKLSP